MNACVNLALTEGQISTCKATQTDFDVPESAGKRSKLLYLLSSTNAGSPPRESAQKYRSLLAMSKDIDGGMNEDWWR